jgi:UDP-glucose 4-epimerase
LPCVSILAFPAWNLTISDP